MGASPRRCGWVLWLVLFLLITGGCRKSSLPALEDEGMMELKLSSVAFQEGKNIPARYTCDGQNISPPLEWTGVPEATQSLVLIADDPDAPAGTWVHWVLYNIEAGLTGLKEGVTGVGVDGTNGFRKTGYGGPCPPKGKAHRYFFKLYALDISLDLKPGAGKADVEKAMRDHILAQGQLMGVYSRQ